MTKRCPFKYFKTSPEVIRLAVMLYVRFPLSLRNVEDLLHERGIEISHETVRFWWNRFGPMFASEIRRNRISRMRSYSNWQWHLDEVFVKINGETHYLWRAVDHEGEVLESYVTKRRDRKAALKFLRNSMKRYGQLQIVVTDNLRSYGAAMKVIGNADRQQTGHWLYNRAENSHLPLRRRGRAMLRFRQIDVCRNSPPFIPPYITISTRNAIYTHATTSSSTEPLHSLSGVSFVLGKLTRAEIN
ncbi:putative transposase [Yoonia sediminilitoris]|uniref:Putative transposase n=1 Tax=Yoonia sediminilitoris TaxID=1286148 RepID=A0A2T6K5Z5_9RHOB|nr:putative transposase [Yoonia sediminilitoris]RCW89651.1 putative transposase [Yoonia sediminilitoris]